MIHGDESTLPVFGKDCSLAMSLLRSMDSLPRSVPASMIYWYQYSLRMCINTKYGLANASLQEYQDIRLLRANRVIL